MSVPDNNAVSPCASSGCGCSAAVDAAHSRRGFLFKTLLGVAGAAATSLPLAGAAEAAKPAPAQATPPRKVPLLGPDGKLHELDVAGTEVPDHPHLPANDPSVRVGVPGRRWVMVIDLAKCDGCKKCTVACNKAHHTPPDREWLKVYEMEDEHHRTYWFPKPCFQCDNPPCTKVCPVDATFKRQDGVVLIDNERCIGCRFCMAACPYSARFFNWGPPQKNVAEEAHAYSPETGLPRKMGTVEKCDFCPDLAAKGILPSCVTSCAMGAIYYGDENEDAVTNSKGETERLHKLLEDRAGYRYMEELGTKPRVHYLPPRGRSYPGPKRNGGKDERLGAACDNANHGGAAAGPLAASQEGAKDERV